MSVAVTMTGWITAQAQQTADSSALGEVVVTATRRETRLQDTPVAVTALSERQLEEQRIQGAADVFNLVPNARLASISQEGSFPQIRGSVTTDYSAGVDRPIAVFVDDIYFSSGTSFLNALFDESQVQVLRGPQGTTFGRNVTGGAIVVTSAVPEPGDDAQIAVTARTNPGIESSGYLNTSVIDNSLFGRLSFDSRHADGTVKNIANGNIMGGTDIDSLRGQLLWKLGDKTRARVGFTFIRDTSPAENFQFVVVGIQPTLMTGLQTSPERTNDPLANTQNTQSAFGFINVQHDFSWATLTSISGYRMGRIRNLVGISTPVPSFIGQFPTDDHQISQEFRLSSPIGRFEWIDGLYFLQLHSQSSRNYTFSPFPGSVLARLQPAGPTSSQLQDITTTSLAPYFEGLLHFTDELALRAGVRYTTEEKKGNTRHTGTLGVVINPAYFVAYSDRFNATTPRAILEYKLSPDIFAYASVSRGFKGGGYSVYALKPQDAATPTQPEKVTSYEGGLKTTWLDNRLLANLTLFDAKTTDLQVSIINPLSNSFTLANAAGSVSKGVELELGAHPIQGLTLRAVYGYIDAQYTKFPRCQGHIDCTGNTPPFTPKNSVTVSGRYEHEIAGGASVYGSLQSSWASATQLNPVNSAYPQSVLDKTALRGVLDLSLGWISPSAKWELMAWGKNIANERAVSAASDLSVYLYTPAQYAGGNRAFRVIYNEGPSAGLTVRWHFK
jgi:iron complex outermembrane receptor protein